MNIHKLIKKRLHVHRGDTPPYMGWRKNQTTRIDLAKLFAELKYEKGAEIGVSRGLNALMLFDNIPNLKLICIDPWLAFRGHSDEFMQGIFQQAQKKLRGHNISIKRMRSLDACKDIKDGSLDFVYIDGMHDFDNVIMDIIHWVPKVKIGGIVSGHDYVCGTSQGVIPAVDAYVAAHGITNLYLTRQPRENHSWFFVRER